jgi:phenylalanyl-tRNA synthetase beta chain
MKISLNFIRGLVDFDLPSVEDVAEKIGAQLGAVEEVIAVDPKYKGAVIVKVISCEKHPNADKLSICRIDDGKVTQNVNRDKDGLVQVVCGAPNVRADMLAVWIPPGVTVPETFDKQPFVLETREIRGVISNGMLASSKELAFSDSHAGILEVKGKYKPGTDLGMKDEYVLDIENKMFTHRPDCFGILGVAREVSGIYQKQFHGKDWYVMNPDLPDEQGAELPLSIVNELPELVPRFTAITLRDVKVGPSPFWLQFALSDLGQKSINNIVDYTNWFMLMSGQPLHAYDYDKVKQLSSGDPKIIVRNPKAGEKITLLNGKEIEPRAEAIMIATDQKAIGLGGVMGGSETEVDDGTKNIILECANFDMYSIRRTSMAHGLFTDAVTRFTKGQSPLQNLPVLMRTVNEIVAAGEGEVAGPVIDDNHLDKALMDRESLYPPVKLSAEFVNQRLGENLSPDQMKQLLENVEFEVTVNGEELSVKAPFWRTDIELREDVVEEVGRLYGYDKLPKALPKRDLTPATRDPLLEAKAIIRDRLSSSGANEVLTYSFVHSDLLSKVGQDTTKTYELSNALSPDLQHYRVSIMPSLLEKVHPNIKAGYDEFALFEMGKTHSTDHQDEAGLPQEFEFTALVVTAADKLKKTGSAYYWAQKYLDALDLPGAEFEFKPVSQEMQQYPVMQPYEAGRSALVSIKDSGEFLGIIGEFKPSVRQNLKLPKFCAGFEVDTEVLQRLFAAPRAYVPLSRFPKVSQDITLRVSAELNYADVEYFVADAIAQARPENSVSSIKPVDIFMPDDTHKHITLRLTIASYDRTLTDGEVNNILNVVAEAALSDLKAERL